MSRKGGREGWCLPLGPSGEAQMEQNDGAGNSLGAKRRKLHIEGKGGEGKKGSGVESGEGSC